MSSSPETIESPENSLGVQQSVPQVGNEVVRSIEGDDWSEQVLIEKWNEVESLKAESVNFQSSFLVGIDWSSCQLGWSKFDHCCLRNCRIANAEAVPVQFESVMMVEICWKKSNFNNVILKQAKILGAERGSLFVDNEMKNADLTKSYFRGVRIHNCNLQEATLENTYFRDCIFSETDFSDANFKNTKINNSKIVDCTWDNTDMAKAELKRCAVDTPRQFDPAKNKAPSDWSITRISK